MINKKRYRIAVFIISAVLLVALCSGMQVATSRKAFINYPGKNIYCRISGFVLFPVTPEGPFPSWVNGIYIELNEGVLLPTSGQTEYVAFRDFKTRYKEITTGTAIVDYKNKIVKVNFTYNDTYKWQRVNGDFPIETIK
jgi:hypothetical protein